MMIPTLIVAFIAFMVTLFSEHYPRTPKIPSHFTNLPAFAMDDLIDKGTAKELMQMFKEIKVFLNNINQSKAQGFKPTYPSIGEDQPISADGTCPYELLYPNNEKTACVFPERIDVGKHFILSGGFDGMKEPVEDMIHRVSSFAKYNFMGFIDNYPVVQQLFNNEKFLDSAKKVCPKEKQYLDAFQFNFIINVPGQSVALHIDAPYFWGASRFHFPQWLLASMAFSGLFQDKFIDQVQVVGYLHEWEEVKEDDGGEFVWYYNETSIGKVAPTYRSGTFVDGSKVIHASRVYRPNVKAPVLPKDQNCELVYKSDEKWVIECDGNEIIQYHTNDLRISVVYRARCFHDEEESKKYNKQLKLVGQENLNVEGGNLILDDVLDTFKADLVKKNIKTREEVDKLSRLELGELIMSTYIKYPLSPRSESFFPINYCALPLVLPWTNSILKFFC